MRVLPAILSPERSRYRVSTVILGSLLVMHLAAPDPARGQACVPPPSGLVNWWPGEGDARDVVGGNDGVLTGAFTAGKVGQAFSFDGDGDFVSLPGTYGGGAEATVVAWVSTSATTADFQAIVSSTAIEFVHLQLAAGGANVGYTLPSPVVLPIVLQTPTGVFRHVAMSLKSGDSRLFVDGALVGSDPATFTSITATSTLRIGSGFGSGRFFKGTIDEVQIYDRALSQAEIQGIVDAGSAGTCQGGPPDHFLAYDVKTTKGTPAFERRQVLLADQFLDGSFRVDQAVALLNPADKNGEGITDADTHLLAYKVKPPQQFASFVLPNVLVENQFGLFTVDVGAPDRLLVPASKNLSTMPLPPDPNAHAVDHFLCYRIKDKVPAVQVGVEDQFNVEPKLFALGNPTRLCNPVDKNEEGIKNADNHLLCFPAKPVRGEPKHVKIVGVFVADQFVGQRVDTKKESEFCVPSTKSVP